MKAAPPEGWRVAPLRDCVDILDSKRVPVNAKERAARPGCVPYYGATGQVDTIDGALFDEDLVLLGEDGVQFFDRNRRKAYRITGKAWVNNHVHVLRPRRDVVEDRFLMHFLNSIDYRGFANGTTRLKLTQAAMQQIPLVLPPLQEQWRIVDLLEDHLSRLDAAVANLDAADGRLRALRSSQLEASKRLAAASGPVLSLGDVAIESRYGTSAKCVVDGPGVPVVRIPNLVAGFVDLTDEKRVQDATSDMSGLMLEAGDVLVVRTNGSRDLIGRAAVVQQGVTAAFASYLIRYRVDASQVHPLWVRMMFDAPSTREVLESMAASSAGQFNLGLRKLDTVALPVPPLAIQADLLGSADATLEAITRLASQVRDARVRAAALRASLLAAAFSGRLSDHVTDTGELVHV